jgi:D-alanine-D-alanine ligase
MKLKVGVLMGGWSPEKKISLMSGKNVVEGLKKAGVGAVPLTLAAADKDEKRLKTRLKSARLDAAFIALHGGFGEDGTLQALLDKWGVPYTGSGALACGLAMHKGCSKLVFEAKGIPTPPWHAIHRSTPPARRMSGMKLSLPVVVKPAEGGSTIGVTVVKKKSRMAGAIRKAFRYGPWTIVEKFIPGREVTVAVLGDRALSTLEIVPKNALYDYDAKYTPGKSEHILPARISAPQTRKVKSLAVRAGKALGCGGYYRADFIVPAKGEPQLLEVNTVPGMTALSLFPDAAKAAGISFPALLKGLVLAALKGKG